MHAQYLRPKLILAHPLAAKFKAVHQVGYGSRGRGRQQRRHPAPRMRELVLALRALPLGAADSLIWIGAHAWATLALATAAREALDINTGQALVVCLLSLIAGFALLVVVGMLVGHWGAFD